MAQDNKPAHDDVDLMRQERLIRSALSLMPLASIRLLVEEIEDRLDEKDSRTG